MKIDVYTKVLLTIIAINLTYFSIKDVGIIPKVHAETENTQFDNNNYAVVPVNANRSMDVNIVSCYTTLDVEVENTVDINLMEVLGYPVGCRPSYTLGGRQYHAIDVTAR